MAADSRSGQSGKGLTVCLICVPDWNAWEGVAWSPVSLAKAQRWSLACHWRVVRHEQNPFKKWPTMQVARGPNGSSVPLPSFSGTGIFIGYEAIIAQGDDAKLTSNPDLNRWSWRDQRGCG